MFSLRSRLIRNKTCERHFWSWVNFVFNRVDHSRVAAVGPDKAAAEWILRLGGSVKFTEIDHWSSDYNRLPSGGKGALKLERIDATEISVTSNGLEHLDGLDALRVLKLSKCKYLYDDGLVYLEHVKHTLKELDLSHCTGITDKGLKHITVLNCLELLDLTDTPGVRYKEQRLQEISSYLPHCKIINRVLQ